MALKGFSYKDRMVKPHKKVSRIVLSDDLIRVRKESEIMLQLCNTRIGIYKACLALSHSQIDDQDPLQLIVIAETKEAIINPKLIDFTKHRVDSKEGCLTFPNNMPIYVNRSHKVTVKAEVLNFPYDGIPEEKTLELSGKRSFCMQHEMDHLVGRYIYEYD